MLARKSAASVSSAPKFCSRKPRASFAGHGCPRVWGRQAYAPSLLAFGGLVASVPLRDVGSASMPLSASGARPYARTPAKRLQPVSNDLELAMPSGFKVQHNFLQYNLQVDLS